MAGGQTALEILGAAEQWTLGEPTIVVLHGDEPFLAGRMLALLRDRLCPDEADRDWAWREFDGGGELDPRTVFDEAATVPMFAGATRAAVVRNADGFVTAARESLETLAAGPRGRRGLVILEVRSLPATTRLAKAVAKAGLAVDVSIPQRFDLAAWVRGWGRSHHDLNLAAATAQMLIERLGGELGQIDQALARLAAAIPAADRSRPIPPEACADLAGSPREQTAWAMIDSAAAGRTAAAVGQLDELLAAGENPIAIAAQIGSVLRKVSTAARLLALPAGAGRPAGIDAALREAGVAAWPKAMDQARDALQQHGPRRSRRLPLWLADLDRQLKGDASRGLRARLAVERFFCMMTRRPDGEATGPRGPRPAAGGREKRR
jgi:DNA polymerase-3 subunit delta